VRTTPSRDISGVPEELLCPSSRGCLTSEAGRPTSPPSLRRWPVAVVCLRRVAVIVLAAGLGATLAGCGGSGDLVTPELSGSSDVVSPKYSYFDVDSPLYRGLDRQGVEDLVNDPAFPESLEMALVGTARDRMAQGMARNLILCRALYGAYIQWTDTGVQPAVPPNPAPTDPLADSSGIWQIIYEDYTRGFALGNLDVLRGSLLAEGGCPGILLRPEVVPNGATIAEALDGR